MDNETLVSALGGQLDVLESYVTWAIVVSLAIAWAGIQNAQEIELLNVKFNRRTAFYAAAVAYLVGNCLILILLLRIGDLMRLLPREAVVEGFSTLSTHSWVLNPFSYFGPAMSSQLHATGGYGLLIVTWWLCNTALFTLSDYERKRGARVLGVLFLLFGLTSMFAIHRVITIARVQLRVVAPDLESAFAATEMQRWAGAFLGILIGILLFTAAERLHRTVRVPRG